MQKGLNRILGTAFGALLAMAGVGLIATPSQGAAANKYIAEPVFEDGEIVKYDCRGYCDPQPDGPKIKCCHVT